MSIISQPTPIAQCFDPNCDDPDAHTHTVFEASWGHPKWPSSVFWDVKVERDNAPVSDGGAPAGWYTSIDVSGLYADDDLLEEFITDVKAAKTEARRLNAADTIGVSK